LLFGLAAAHGGELPGDFRFEESGGRVAGQAETYHQKAAAAGADWTEVAAGDDGFGGSTGDGHLVVLPDDGGGTTDWGGGPSVDYKLRIDTPGTYRLWLRWAGVDGGSDSIFAGLVELADGAGGAPDWYQDSGHTSGDFDNPGWDGDGEAEVTTGSAAQNAMLWTIATTGDYTLRFAAREDGAALDAWALQLDSLPDPASGAPWAVADSITMHHGRKAAVPVLDNDFFLGNLDRIELVNAPEAGTASVVDGRILYEHQSGTPAGDDFSYRLVDSAERVSNEVAVTVEFSNQIRIPNTTLTVPLEPPTTSYAVVEAFADLDFSSPVAMATPPGETQRLFVCEKGGRIRLIPDVTAAMPDMLTFLNLAQEMTTRPGESLNTGSESGLIGLAFHPNYASNGYFYVFYSVNISGQRHQRVSRFSVSGDPNVADPDSEVVLIEQFDEAGNHNGGDLHFGPDGYLYISVGDEGGANDFWENSQRITKDYFAGILRIDVDNGPGSLPPNPHPSNGWGTTHYSVPADNPWVGATSFNDATFATTEVITEFYAVGLRNPWRMSFDPVTGELWCGDVGQGLREEINLIEKGGNYGWSFFEGNLAGPDSAPTGFVQDPPLYEYSRGTGPLQGTSVTGGVVYRGGAISELEGAYVFGDYGSDQIWMLQRVGGGVEVERIAGTPDPVAFGRDPSNGDVLVASISLGQIGRLVADASGGGAFPATLSETGVFASLDDLAPNPGVLGYEPNLAFWSDHALKDRWFVIPDLAGTIGYAAEDPWSFPEGMIWIKHFEIETERGNPLTRKRLETRLLVRDDSGAFGVSYRWNDSGSEAFLVADEGEDFDLEIDDGSGSTSTQTWRIPSRAECLSCHQPAAGHALSFHTRQLNLDGALGGFAGNQIETLDLAGYLVGAPASTASLPRHLRPDESEYSLEARVRSYLDVNCANCHRPGGSAPANWDARAELKLSATGLIDAVPINDGGDPTRRLVKVGDTGASVLLHRVAASGGLTRMPPLASNELDQEAIQLLSDWIASELPASHQSYDEWRLVEFGSATSPEGEPGANPDGDRSDNEIEWLARRDPQDHADDWTPELLRLPGGGFELSFERIFNRVVRVECSPGLDGWEPLEVEGNDGLPPAMDEMESLIVPASDPTMFFRWVIEER